MLSARVEARRRGGSDHPRRHPPHRGRSHGERLALDGAPIARTPPLVVIDPEDRARSIDWPTPHEPSAGQVDAPGRPPLAAGAERPDEPMGLGAVVEATTWAACGSRSM